MKKALSYFMILSMLIMTLIVPTEKFQAYEANLSVGLSSSNIKIGETVTVTVKVPGAVSGPVSLYFPTDVLEYSSTSTEASVAGGTVQFSIGKGGRAASDTVTVKLKAKTSGTANIKVAATGDIYDYDSLEEVKLNGTSATLTIANQTTGSNNGGGTTEPQKSGDNSLSSLKLSSGTLSPGFKYNVTKYTATVGYDVTQVVVSAKTSNEKATIESVTGNGTVNLKVGENTIQVVVKAENGVKATYTIVVTRKAQDDTVTPDPSESTSESETTTPEVNEMLQWNGEQLQLSESIPAESIPADFESTLLVVNGQQMTGLSFLKGDLKLLYLNNTNGAGSFYVYDEARQTIYPFIKLIAEKSYVMVLLPDEQNAPAPEGFESCTFSIEGKGIVNAYQLKEDTENPVEHETLDDSGISWNLFGAETFYAAEAKASDFYLIYCMNHAGETGWYMYDSVEGTFQRYFASAYSVQTGGEASEPSDAQDKYAELEKELESAKMTQYIIIGIALAVAIILIIVIVVLVLKNRSKEEDFFEGYEEDEYGEYEYEGYDEEYDEKYDEEEYDEGEAEETLQNTIQETVVEENTVEETETVAETVEVDTTEGDDDEIEIEFYDMEELLVEEVESIEKEVSEKPVVKAEAEVIAKPEPVIQRRERMVDPTSKLSSIKEDDGDLEFIDFE